VGGVGRGGRPSAMATGIALSSFESRPRKRLGCVVKVERPKGIDRDSYGAVALNQRTVRDR